MALEATRAFASDATNTGALRSPVFGQARIPPGFKRLVTDLKLVDSWRNSDEWGNFCKPTRARDFERH